MKVTGVRWFKARLEHFLRAVQRGETVFVIDRGRVVAEVRRPDARTATVPTSARRLMDAVEAGFIRLPTAPDPTSLWRDFKPLRLPEGTAGTVLEDARAERQ